MSSYDRSPIPKHMEIIGCVDNFFFGKFLFLVPPFLERAWKMLAIDISHLIFGGTKTCNGTFLIVWKNANYKEMRGQNSKQSI